MPHEVTSRETRPQSVGAVDNHPAWFMDALAIRYAGENAKTPGLRFSAGLGERGTPRLE
jgi:hypothetical protein